MKKSIAILSIVTLGVAAMPAQAHQDSYKNNRTDRIDRIEQRLDNQRFRIRAGIDNGELTRKEVKRLRKNQRYIKRLKRQFMRDGYLDRYEFSELKYELKRSSKRIYRLKHNGRFQHVHYDRHRR